MKICVRDAFTSHSYNKEYSFRFTAAELAELPDGAKTEYADVKMTVSSESGTVTCETEIKANFKTFCSRCLKDIDLPLEIRSKRLIRKEQDEFEDVIYVDAGYCFDAAEEVRVQINFEFPAKPLCSEDCKGLCPVCGCDLNSSSCSCDIRTTDPRLAVLKKLIDK